MKAKKVKIILTALLAFVMVIGTSAISSFAAPEDHTWGYKKVGDTVKIQCVAEHECDFQDYKDITIVAYDVEYDGQPHPASVTGLDDFAADTYVHQQGDIRYSENETVYPYTHDAPTAVGKYYAEVNIDMDYATNPFRAEIQTSFEISAKKVEVTWTPEEFVYNRGPQGPEPSIPDDAFVTGEDVKLSDVVFKNEAGEVLDDMPTNAGKYTAEVELEGADKDNYDLQKDVL